MGSNPFRVKVNEGASAGWGGHSALSGFQRSDEQEDVPAAEVVPVGAEYAALESWGLLAAERCGVSLTEWRDAVRIFLQTFGAAPGILEDLQNDKTFWETLHNLGWEFPTK